MKKRPELIKIGLHYYIWTSTFIEHFIDKVLYQI